jgi:hypothetical protein
MNERMAGDASVYAVGKRIVVDHRGFAAETAEGGSEATIPVPVSAYMLLRRDMYVDLPPFEHHGLPVLKNCVEARERGWRIADFPTDEYVEHLGRGTAERFGYGLGWRSRLDFFLHRLGL